MKVSQDYLRLYEEVLNIYNVLYSKKLDAFQIRQLYVDYLKIIIRLGSNKPCFKENLDGFLYGNCYGYALGVKCPAVFVHKILEFDDYGIPFNPGFISDESHLSCPQSSNELIDGFCKDMDCLNVEVYDCDNSPSHGGYKIFIFADKEIKQNCNYHFVRQNDDGLLSHRLSEMGNVETLQDLNSLTSSFELVKSLEIVKPVIRERTLYVGR